MNIFQSMVAVVSLMTLSQGVANEATVDWSLIDKIRDDFSDTCTPAGSEDKCFALVSKILKAPEYDHPRIKFLLTELLVAHPQTHPKGVHVAREILEDLRARYPQEALYVEQQAVVEFTDSAIRGLAFSEQNELYTKLAIQLHGYLGSNRISDDIVSYALRGFEQRVQSGKDIGRTLSTAKISIEIFRIYRDEEFVSRFVSDAREQIPWNSWREILNKTEFQVSGLDEKEMTKLLIVYCEPTVFLLDDGEFCSKAIETVHEQAKDDLKPSKFFLVTANWIIAKIVELKPEKIGNAAALLGDIIANAKEP